MIPDNQFVKNADVYDVPIVPLKQICRKYFGEGKTIYFLKIDVEGWEKECIESMDFQKWRPWILCIESTFPGTHTPCWDKWEKVILDQDYIFADSNGINRYYVSKEKQSLKKFFRDKKQMDEKYKILYLPENDEFFNLYNRYLRDKGASCIIQI